MKKQRKKEWFDNDAFWIELSPFVSPIRPFESAAEEVEKIIRLAKLNGKCVLDLCCGIGRHSIELAKRHFTVTGVDRAIFLLDKAKKEAKSANVEIEWVQQDMRDFIRENSFNLILNIFNSFGYFEDKQDNMVVLENILKSLKPKGVCIFELASKEWFAKIFQPTTSEKLTNGTILIRRYEIVDSWSRVRSEWILIKNGRAKFFNLNYAIYSGKEFKDLLIRVGFKDVNLFGDFDGKGYGVHSNKIIAVAQKK